jgi:hypothetical protein
MSLSGGQFGRVCWKGTDCKRSFLRDVLQVKTILNLKKPKYVSGNRTQGLVQTVGNLKDATALLPYIHLNDSIYLTFDIKELQKNMSYSTYSILCRNFP